MPKQMIEIEVDVPVGYEAVGFRPPKNGEEFIGLAGAIAKASCDFKKDSYVVIRRQWEWPSWLLAPWIAMDKCGSCYAYTHEPLIGDKMWRTRDGDSVRLSNDLFHFTPPPCDDWRESKRKNPNHA